MTQTKVQAPLIAGDQALTISQADAVKVYRDLSIDRIELILEPDGWHVDYELRAPHLKGRAPITSSTPRRERLRRSGMSSERRTLF